MGSKEAGAHDVGVELEITGLAGGGRGVAREGGRVWLVEGALPGQRVRARARRIHPRWVDAVVGTVVRRAAGERPAPCPFHAACGGCAWMGLPEDAQRGWKRRIVEDALARLGGLRGVPVSPVIPSPSSLAYRNKVELTFGPKRLGYHPPGDPREVVDVAACLLADPAMNRAVALARRFFLAGPGAGDPALPATGERREPLRLVVRRSRAEGRLLVALRGEPGPFPSAPAFARALLSEVPEVAGVVRLLARRGRRGGSRAEVLWGRGSLRETVGGIGFEVPAGAFFQVNPEAAEFLLEQVAEAAGPVEGHEVLELYGGMGVFGLALARAGARVTVCEADADAVAAGRAAAARHGLAARLVQGDVARGLTGRPHLVLADPPRSGLGPGVAAGIASLGPSRVVIVSCDPATLARDVRVLVSAGYGCQRVVPLDLFPQTPHVETVTVLTAPGA